MLTILDLSRIMLTRQPRAGRHGPLLCSLSTDTVSRVPSRLAEGRCHVFVVGVYDILLFALRSFRGKKVHRDVFLSTLSLPAIVHCWLPHLLKSVTSLSRPLHSLDL